MDARVIILDAMDARVIILDSMDAMDARVISFVSKIIFHIFPS